VAPAPIPEPVPKPLPQPLETLKRFVEQAPEAKVVRTITRWLKTQPPPDPPPPGVEPRPYQSR
jgi:hypothetical protein